VLGIVLASLWILVALGSGLSMIFVFSLAPAFQQIAGFRAVLIWGVVGALLGGAIGVVLLSACIGCLRICPWGQRWMVRYAIADLAWIAIKLVVSLAWVVPLQRSWINAPFPAPTTLPAPATPGGAPTTNRASTGAPATIRYNPKPTAAMVWLGPTDPAFNACSTSVVSAIYPAAVLFYMTRPRIRGAFTPVEGA
jgi:hypothetical protein